MTGFFLSVWFQFGPLLGCLVLLGLLAIPKVNPKNHRRFRAALVDALIGMALVAAGWVAMAVVARVPFVRSFGLSGSIVGVSWCVMYLVFRDGFRFGQNIRRSFGKQLAEVQPVSVRGGSLYMSIAIGRNLTAAPLVFLIVSDLKYAVAGWALLEIILVWMTPSGRRIGDRLAGTRVEERGLPGAEILHPMDDVRSLSVDQDEEAELVRQALRRSVTGHPSRPMSRSVVVERIACRRVDRELQVTIAGSARFPEVGFSFDRSLGLPGFVVRVDGVPDPYPEHEIVVDEGELQRIWAIHEPEHNRLNVVLLLNHQTVDVIEAIDDDGGVRVRLGFVGSGGWISGPGDG